ncbi:DUF2157 domain-containing protein [Nocardia uniformis]|uniref:DUF2157 domain-containing protein n=1 Tax=Nocardia uniformis TaxID=53432 RepID=A0A849BVT6_9NOCA|nr:DUF2157 domain-containing protein [Nocardia uniformis]NNH70324.1 DUF2157 domain-containing protein [Nocardia uniformis]
MTDERRLGAALGRLVDEGVVTPAQRDAVAAAVAEERPGGGSLTRLFAEIAAYAGAGLVLGGIILLLDSTWDELDRLGQLITLTVLAVGLTVGGMLLAGGRSGLFVRDAGARTVPMRLAAVLFLLAALCVTAIVGTVADENGAEHAWLWAVTAGLVATAVGYAALPSLVGLLGTALFAGLTVGGSLREVVDAGDPWVGIGLVALGGIWFALSRSGHAAPPWAGYSIAIATALIGAQIAGYNQTAWTYTLTVLVAVVCFALYAGDRHGVLIIGGGAALALAVSQSVWDWSDHAAGGALTVLISGAIVLGVGAVLLLRDRG